MNNNMSTTLPGLLPSVTLTTTTAGTGYTISTANVGLSNTSIFSSPAMSVEQTGLLDLKGENADIVINGVSLSESIKAIEQRLNLLTVNPKLEAEWDQLRELGEQYRRLEAELLEKQRMWETLKNDT